MIFCGRGSEGDYFRCGGETDGSENEPMGEWGWIFWLDVDGDWYRKSEDVEYRNAHVAVLGFEIFGSKILNCFGEALSTAMKDIPIQMKRFERLVMSATERTLGSDGNVSGIHMRRLSIIMLDNTVVLQERVKGDGGQRI